MYLYYIAICLVLASLILAWEITKQKQALDKKNTDLIKYHLDAKFMRKCLLESIKINDSNMFCNNFIKIIREYYYLEDVIVIDSIYSTPEQQQADLRQIIISYLRDNHKDISLRLNSKRLVKIDITLQRQGYILYISRILDHNESSYIVCVEKSASILTHQEQISLENSINFLRHRILL